MDGILRYISLRLNNKDAARTLLDEYENRLTNLRETPRLYGLTQLERLARRGYRRFVFGNYIAFYSIDDIEKKVYIVRIFHQNQDYEDML